MEKKKRYVRLLTNADIDMFERVITELKVVARVSKMEESSFSDEIKQETRLWRESWITSPIEHGIDELSTLIKRLERIMKEDE